MEFQRTRIWERHTTATEVLTKDLPVNALSHLVITLDGYNVTDEATLAEIIAFLNNIRVSKEGVTVVDLQSEDLYAINARLFHGLPTLTGRLATDNYTRSLTLIVPFGRRLYDPTECFPATKKGELTLAIDCTVPSSSLDNSTISVDAVELPGASPARHLKSYRKALSAPGSTGEHEIELAIGNKLCLAQLRLTTVPTTSSHTFGVDVIKLMVDNKEHLVAAADVMCLAGERFLNVPCPDTTIAAQGLSPLNNIVWMDLMPTDNDDFLLDTAGHSSVKLNLNYGVDEAQQLSLLELVNN